MVGRDAGPTESRRHRSPLGPTSDLRLGLRLSPSNGTISRLSFHVRRLLVILSTPHFTLQSRTVHNFAKPTHGLLNRLPLTYRNLNSHTFFSRDKTSKINKTRKTKKAAKKQAAVETAAPAAVETTVKVGATVTLEHVKAVALTVKTLGGFVRLNELLGLIKEVGGLKKFKDLLEAISGTETDAIPF